MNDEKGGKDVDSVEEAEMSSRPSLEYVYDNDYSVGEFDASTCAGDNVMIFMGISKKSLLQIQFFGSTLIKQFWKVASLKYLSVN